MASFYIGLSLLSNNPVFRPGNGLLHSEGRRLLGDLVNHPVREEEIALEKGGRPYFTDGRGDFSISHSGSAAAISWAPCGGLPRKTGVPIRTGCDIQYMKPLKFFRAIAEAYFSPAEGEYIFAQVSDQLIRFYEIWVLKECYLKLRGLSIFDLPRLPSFIAGKDFSFTETEQYHSGDLPLSFYLYQMGAYMLAVAAESDDVPVIRRYSQGVLPLRSIAAVKAAVNPAKTVSPKI
jgi:phosphopantetheinyl transferase